MNTELQTKLAKKQLLYLNVLKWVVILAVIGGVAYYAQERANKWGRLADQIESYNHQR